MFIMATVASLCGVVLILGLVAQACRHRKDLWIASDNAILCAVSPGVIMLSTFAVVALVWRITHGGFGMVPRWGWIGSGIIVSISILIWRTFAPRMRAGAHRSVSAAPASASTVPTPY